jgi:hypothetical protein
VYCDYRDKDKQDMCSIIGELAKQLLLQSSSVAEEVWSLFEKHTTITTENAKQALTHMLRSFDGVYLCIDALDECQPQVRRELLSFLVTLKGAGLRIFCTGRTHIMAEARTCLKTFGLETMEIYAHEADIRLHLEEMISRDPHKGAMDEQLQEQITTTLISHRL